MRERFRSASDVRGIVVAPLVSIVTIGVAAATDSLTWYEAPAVAVAMCACIWTIGGGHSFAQFLPLAKRLLPAIGPLLLLPMMLAAGLLTRQMHIPWRQFGVVCLAASLGMVLLSSRRLTAKSVTRIAVLGDAELASALTQELDRLPSPDWHVVGYVDEFPVTSTGAEAGHLGARADLAAIIEAGGIDLLLVNSEEARRSVYELLAGNCLDMQVRVSELASFYEDTFGLTAVAAIEPSWLQSVLHPRYLPTIPRSKRLFDVVVSLVVGVVAVPVLIFFAALVKLDGGPVFYRQVRIGERGRPFEILKLRSMRPSDGREQWSSRTDPRVTWVGRFMRRTHIDELPQIVNVLRGDMSIVGPRPEQPDLVKRLDAAIPYYNLRHLARPGVTGWAQVRCGYAGSEVGSALKACYDLYYIKHRSFSVDCLILLETIRTLVFDRQWQNDSAHRVLAIPLALRTPAIHGGRAPAPLPRQPLHAGIHK